MSKSNGLVSHGVQTTYFALLTLMMWLARLAPFVEPPGRQAATLADGFLNGGGRARKAPYYVFTRPEERRMRRSHLSCCGSAGLLNWRRSGILKASGNVSRAGPATEESIQQVKREKNKKICRGFETARRVVTVGRELLLSSSPGVREVFIAEHHSVGF
jgi:hypothetical protein